MVRGWFAVVTLVAAVAVFLAVASPAFAYNETTGYPLPLGHPDGDSEPCLSCHGYATEDGDCFDCHGEVSFGQNDPQYGRGPHAGYTTGSQRCSICHTIHNSDGNYALLPKPTITEVCQTCHDGTGGSSVYGTILNRTGSLPGQQHRIDTTRIIPGGAADGGSLEATFTGVDGNLTCTDCHNPHNADTVSNFLGERRRVPYSLPYREAWQSLETNRLLRKRPGNATESVDAYGSGWCIGCHQGRMSGSATANNHPSDEGTGSFTYGNVAVLNSDASTTRTVMGPLAGTNRGYLMPYPRTAQQGAHKPLCQQCHEDSRNVGVLTGNSGDAATFTVSVDGTVTASNPRFQNFPHETVNEHMLVEPGDNLCLNCHVP